MAVGGGGGGVYTLDLKGVDRGRGNGLLEARDSCGGGFFWVDSLDGRLWSAVSFSVAVWLRFVAGALVFALGL